MSDRLVSAVVAVDAAETAARVIDALRAQSIVDRLELVLVGPGVRPPDGSVDGFASVVTVDHSVEPLSVARAQGIAAAGGRTVFMAETHAFPRAECLELLDRAVAGGATAAVPRLVNANPATARSWASLFATYGAYTGRHPRALDGIVLHNVAFERDALAEVASHPTELIYGVGLSAVLRRRRCEMRYEPGAVVDHLNVASWSGIAADRLLGGRLWAGVRSREWSPLARTIRVLGAPLGPIVMLGRILRSDGWNELGPATPRGTRLALVAGAALQSIGEVQGYARGVGTAEQRHLSIELHREAYL